MINLFSIVIMLACPGFLVKGIPVRFIFLFLLSLERWIIMVNFADGNKLKTFGW